MFANRRPSPRNRLTKYLLRKWLYYDENMPILSDTELTNMKILYSSLKTLNEYETKFLAEKYRVNKSHPETDAILAHSKNITLKDYRKKRIEIEDKLRFTFKENIEKQQEELSKAVKLECGR